MAYGRRTRIYPLAQAASPPETRFVDAIDTLFDSTIPYDLRFFQALDRFVQREPWIERDRAMIDPLRTIGIEKGKPFNPDAATQEILTASAREAHAWLDAGYEALFSPSYFEGTRWALPVSQGLVEGMQSNFANRDSYPIDSRGIAYSFAFFSAKHLGEGPVLPVCYPRPGRAILRRRQHLSPRRAGSCAGPALLVGDRL